MGDWRQPGDGKHSARRARPGLGPAAGGLCLGLSAGQSGLFPAVRCDRLAGYVFHRAGPGCPRAADPPEGRGKPALCRGWRRPPPRHAGQHCRQLEAGALSGGADDRLQLLQPRHRRPLSHLPPEAAPLHHAPDRGADRGAECRLADRGLYCGGAVGTVRAAADDCGFGARGAAGDPAVGLWPVVARAGAGRAADRGGGAGGVVGGSGLPQRIVAPGGAGDVPRPGLSVGQPDCLAQWPVTGRDCRRARRRFRLCPRIGGNLRRTGLGAAGAGRSRTAR